MKDYRRKRSFYIKLVLIIIVTIGVLVFTGYSLKKEKNLNFFESIVKDVGVFIGDTFYAPVKFVKNKVEISKEKEDIYKKYKNLQKRENKIEQVEARNNELEKENSELKKILNINSSLSDFEKINASVISRKVGYWYDKLVINKGSKDGIEPKMAVVIENGVVGYISEVSSGSSNVQLLTAKTLKNKISVRIDLGNQEYANGLLIGYDKEKNIYNIEGISYSGEIPENSRVTTTGLNDNFPSGILIGYVSKTTTDSFDLGKIVEVSPSANLNNIEFVTVLKRKDTVKW